MLQYQQIYKSINTLEYTEHSYRIEFSNLLNRVKPSAEIEIIHEPKRSEFGAPDFRVRKGAAIIGYIETKKPDSNLEEILKSEQIKKYLDAIDNFILTDYNRLILVRNGEVFKSAIITEDLSACKELFYLFFEYKPQVKSDYQSLAHLLAKRAILMKEIISEKLKTESKEKSVELLNDIYQSFRKHYSSELSIEEFADAYAQTIAYGLLLADYYNAENLTAKHTEDYIPESFGLIHNIFSYSNKIKDPDFLFIFKEMLQIIKSADLEQFKKSIVQKNINGDPMVYFYEYFLKEYNPKLRKIRGVYYTPIEAVNYIVQSIDEILKKEFNLSKGLADNCIILDPATGTGTFLAAVIRKIHKNLAKFGLALSISQLQESLKNIYGFELLVAPYVMAHLKLISVLRDLDYQFQEYERLNIYLNNALNIQKANQQTLFSYLDRSFAEETKLANEVKTDKKVMVILGNPPYSVSTQNKSEWITNLIEDYKQIEGEKLKEQNIQPLQDDYLKFIRFAHWKINKTGEGIIGLITNNSYLSGLIHRAMRWNLQKDFNKIYILNLHGNSLIKETAPDGSIDQNIFDIRVGVSIVLFIKNKNLNKKCNIYYADLFGKRESKLEFLDKNNIFSHDFVELNPIKPEFFFVQKDFSAKKEYDDFISVKDIFLEYNAGIVTSRDKFVIDISKTKLEQKIKFFLDKKNTNEAIEKNLGLKDQDNFKFDKVRNIEFNETKITKYAYRPFDTRFIYYEPLLIERHRFKIMSNMALENLGLCLKRRMMFDKNDNIIINRIVDYHLLNDQTYLFPLYLYSEDPKSKHKQKVPNLKSEYLKKVKQKLGKVPSPEEIIAYIYAVLHNPNYREKYLEFLKIDFPRIPLPNKETFADLVAIGQKLIDLHLLKIEDVDCKFEIIGDNTISKGYPKFKNNRVYINKLQYFEPIAPEEYQFQIGGFKPMEKWLKDRKGRALTADDLFHYMKMHKAIKETISLMEELKKFC